MASAKIPLPVATWIARAAPGSPLCLSGLGPEDEAIDGLGVEIYTRENARGEKEIIGVRVTQDADVVTGYGFVPYEAEAE